MNRFTLLLVIVVVIIVLNGETVIKKTLSNYVV